MKTAKVWFDVNGSCGKRARGDSDYPTLQDRLDFMNRFGIARSLVWNVEAEQNHAGAANQALVEWIRHTPGARGRIWPAFSVSGLMTYENRGIETLSALMKAEGARALRFANTLGLLSLRQLAPVMMGIREQNPFLVMGHDQAGVDDILDFTARFPDIPLILTNVGWGVCIKVFDLMRQRKNILLDHSWLHTCGAIELVVQHFGADRIVFGTGYPSQNGAALAALARAGISEDQRDQIACGNLERLTGLPPCVPVPVRAATGNTLWPRFLEGRPVGVDTVDAHGHLGPSGGYVLEAQAEDEQAALAIRMMKAAGIETMMISGLQSLMGGPVSGNDLLEKVLKPHAGRLLGYVAFNPFYADELVPELDRYFAGSIFVGFKTLCDYWNVPITDSRFTPMWEYAQRHRLPVLSHTWDGRYDSPAQFKDLVRQYPDVSFLLGHSGGGERGRVEAVDLARNNPNVFLEWCGSFCCRTPWEKTLREVGAEQVVFGTDAMAHDIHWELGRLLSLDVPDEVLVPILGTNMRRILAMRR